MRPYSNLSFFLAANFFWSLGLMTFFLLYNLHLAELGLSVTLMGQVFAAGTVGTVLASAAAGWATDRWGPKATLITATAVVAISLVWRSTLETRAMLLGSSFVTGVGIALWFVAVPPFLGSATGGHGQNRSSAFAATYGLSILTGAVAGLGGAALASSIGMQASLGACSISCAVALLFLCGIRPDARSTVAGRPSHSFADIARANRKFLVPFLSMVLVWDLLLGAFPPFFNVFFTQRHQLGVVQLGWLFSCAQFLQALAVMSLPLWVPRLGARWSIAGCQFLCFPFFLLLALASGSAWSGAAYIASATLQALTSPLIDQFVVANVDQTVSGRAVGMKFFVSQAAVALAAVAAGALIDHYGYTALLVAASTLALVSAVLTVRMRAGQSRN
ncbi:MAG: MFS transporter [Acidobacteriota bacterium]